MGGEGGGGEKLSFSKEKKGIIITFDFVSVMTNVIKLEIDIRFGFVFLFG